MTIDEAIKHEEEVAVQQIQKANALDNIPLFGMSKDDIEEIKECYKCSKEHEQLAEWLKELKIHREAWMKVVSAIDQHTEIHSDGEFYIKNFDVKKIIAEYRPKEGDTE